MARGPFEGCRPRRQHLPEPPPQDQEAAGPLCPLCSSTNLQTPAALSIQAPVLADALPSKPTVVRKGSAESFAQGGGVPTQPPKLVHAHRALASHSQAV